MTCPTTKPSSITTLTFYKHVEPLSVTPFSPGALQRGLAGLLVSLVRLRGMEFNPNEAASRITTGNPYVQDAIETIAKRAELIGDGPKTGDFCRAELLSKADIWQAEAQNTTGGRYSDLYRTLWIGWSEEGNHRQTPSQPRHGTLGGVHLPQFATRSRAAREVHHQ